MNKIELTRKKIAESEFRKFGFSKQLVVKVIEEETEKQARRAIDKSCGNDREGKDIIIVRGKDASFNRKILENKKVNILLSPESEKLGKKQDKLYERDSGLNHILCKIAKQNSKIIAIDLSEILALEGKEKAKYLARVMQNIRLCKKYKVSMVITSLALSQKGLRNIYDLESLCITLGMPTDMAKQAVEKAGLAKFLN